MEPPAGIPLGRGRTSFDDRGLPRVWTNDAQYGEARMRAHFVEDAGAEGGVRFGSGLL
jgi:hypothetical protein